MAFTRVVLGWLAATAFFGCWRLLEQRVRATAEPAGAALRGALPSLALEAALLTLLAGLWFASLGHGGTWLVFLLVGALVEVPHRVRYQPLGAVAWKPIVGGVLRVVVAGVLLGLVLG